MSRIPKWYWIVPLIIALFCLLIGTIQLVGAVNIETATYKIDCSPEIATIQFNGFHQQCSYLLKQGSWSGDVAFCFDTPINNGKVLYHLSNGSLLDITPSFKYQFYDINKGDCYYVKDVSFLTNDLKILDIYYLPNDLSKSPKWDTYFGNISQGRVDLRLDPVFNVSYYELGSNRSSSYQWEYTPDLINTSANIYFNYLSNNQSQFAQSLFNNTLFLNNFIFNSSRINERVSNLSFNIGCSCCGNSVNARATVVYFDGSFDSSCSISTVCSSGDKNVVKSCSYSNDRLVDYVSLNLSYGGAPTSFMQNISISYNISGRVNVSSSITNSQIINLSSFVSQYKLNASFIGSGFINISFNGSSWQYINLSNTSWITPLSPALSNNRLQYVINLSSSNARLFNFSLILNSSLAYFSTNIYEKVSGARINYSVNWSISPTFFYNTSDVIATNLTTLQGLNNISINKSGYYGCNYLVQINSSVVLQNCSLSNDRISLFVYDTFTGLNLNVFNGSICSGSYCESFSTTNSSMTIYWLKNTSTNISISPSGYSPFTINFTSFSGSDLNQTLRIGTFTGLNISIYDESTLALITQNVSIRVTDITNSLVYTTSSTSGVANLNLNLGTGIFEVRFDSMNYSSRRYYFSGSNIAFNAYLLPYTISENLSICFYDTNGAVIPNLLVYENVLSNSSFLTVQSSYTDIMGRVFFIYNPISYYKYNYTNGFYSNTPFTLNPPRNNAVLSDGCNYDIGVKLSTSFIADLPVNVSGGISWNNLTEVLTFSYIGNNSNASLFSYHVIKLVNNQQIVLCAGNSSNSIDSFNCLLTGYKDLVYVQGTADNTIFFGSWFDLGSPGRLFDNLNRFDAAYLSGFILLIILCAGVFFGLYGTLISGVAGLWLIAILGILTPITLSLVVVDMVVSCVLALLLRR